jgi:hypothetical protein
MPQNGKMWGFTPLKAFLASGPKSWPRDQKVGYGPVLNMLFMLGLVVIND